MRLYKASGYYNVKQLILHPYSGGGNFFEFVCLNARGGEYVQYSKVPLKDTEGRSDRDLLEYLAKKDWLVPRQKMSLDQAQAWYEKKLAEQNERKKREREAEPPKEAPATFEQGKEALSKMREEFGKPPDSSV